MLNQPQWSEAEHRALAHLGLTGEEPPGVLLRLALQHLRNVYSYEMDHCTGDNLQQAERNLSVADELLDALGSDDALLQRPERPGLVAWARVTATSPAEGDGFVLVLRRDMGREREPAVLRRFNPDGQVYGRWTNADSTWYDIDDGVPEWWMPVPAAPASS